MSVLYFTKLVPLGTGANTQGIWADAMGPDWGGRGKGITELRRNVSTTSSSEFLENDPAPIQGTAKAILLRPRPHPFPRQQPKKPSRGETPEAPQSTAGRSDAWEHPKRAKRGRAEPPRGEYFTGQGSGRGKGKYRPNEDRQERERRSRRSSWSQRRRSRP